MKIWIVIAYDFDQHAEESYIAHSEAGALSHIQMVERCDNEIRKVLLMDTDYMWVRELVPALDGFKIKLVEKVSVKFD